MEELDDSTPIWRYMSQSKFLRMLEQEALYFRNATLFDDALEGQFSWNVGYHEFIKFHKKEARDNGSQMPWQTWVATILHDFEVNRRISYVNCWRYGEEESEAMWKLYCQDDLNNAVVIKSTIGALKEELGKQKLYNMRLGKLKYHKQFYWDSSTITPEILFNKRLAFEHEKEFRIVFQEKNEKKAYESELTKGHLVPVNSSNLIKEVRLSPFYDYNSPNYEKCKVAIRKLKAPYFRSAIETEPYISTSFNLKYKGKPRDKDERKHFKSASSERKQAQVISRTSSPFEINIKNFDRAGVMDIDVHIKLRKDDSTQENLEKP